MSCQYNLNELPSYADVRAFRFSFAPTYTETRPAPCNIIIPRSIGVTRLSLAVSKPWEPKYKMLIPGVQYRSILYSELTQRSTTILLVFIRNPSPSNSIKHTYMTFCSLDLRYIFSSNSSSLSFLFITPLSPSKFSYCKTHTNHVARTL
jgi:hypothetical protein